MIALTSLSPNPARLERQRACIASWQRAGLERVVSLNHPDEIATIDSLYPGVRFAPLRDRQAQRFWQRPLVPLDCLLCWVAVENTTALLINADYELTLTPPQLALLEGVSSDGLAYLLQLNGAGDRTKAVPEPCGISAFIIRPGHARLRNMGSALMVFGKPWWDYLLPYVALTAGQPLYTPVRPSGYHEAHEGQWRAEDWERTADEFARLTGQPIPTDNAGRSQLSAAAHAAIKAHTTMVELA